MRKKYIPDLVTQNARQEQNYWRLLKLMPDWQQQKDWCYSLGDSINGQVSIELTERFKFTTALQLSIQAYNVFDQSPLILNIRMYHDVCMAEVVACANGSQFSGIYPYPNSNMCQVNEKELLNAFLCDWLLHCLNNATNPTKLGFNNEKM